MNSQKTLLTPESLALGQKKLLTQEFLLLYKMYELTGDEGQLLAFNELGRKMNQAAMPPETAVELFALAQQQSAANLPVHEQVLPLMEVIMTYGLNYRRQIQWQKDHSNTQFYSVLEASTHLIFITDQSQRIHYTNPAFERHFTRQQCMQCADCFGFFSFDSPKRQMLNQLSRGERWQGQITATTKDNHTVVLEITAFPIELGGRQSSHYVFMAEDITEKLVMERRLSQSQRLSTLGELASGITHEFNNVMTIISGFAELIKDETDTASRNDYIKEILAAIDKGKSLNQQILSFAADRNPEITPASLPKMLAAINQFVTTAIGSKIVLNVGQVPDIEVNLNEQHLCQLLTNLCINARHAIEQQQQTGQRSGRIDITILIGETAPWLEIRIKDNGVGMSQEVKKQIFEPFFTTKDVGEGTGLGLALLQKLVHEYQGEIQVISQLGTGTEFILHLPVVVASQADSTNLPAPTPLLKQWVRNEQL